MIDPIEFDDGRARIPPVTVLLCTHIASADTYDCLASIFAQTYSEFECLVILNGQSRLALRDTIRSWFPNEHRLRLVLTDIRQLTFSLNLGVHLARGALVARADSDDLYPPDRLRLQVEAFARDPNLGVLGSDYDVIDGLGRMIRTVSLPKSDTKIRAKLPFGNPLCHPSVMFRKALVERIGGYPGVRFAQDYELWLALATSSDVKFANLHEICVSYRSAGTNGGARGSALAYAAASAACWRSFCAGAGGRWLVGALVWCAKALAARVRSGRRPSDKTR